MATDTLEFKLVMRPAKMNFAVADAHRDNRKRFVVRADEKLTRFVELERPITSSRWMQSRKTSHSLKSPACINANGNCASQANDPMHWSE
jgi:hypothetical protein